MERENRESTQVNGEVNQKIATHLLQLPAACSCEPRVGCGPTSNGSLRASGEGEKVAPRKSHGSLHPLSVGEEHGHRLKNGEANERCADRQKSVPVQCR